jgi:hypothetical protein
LLSKICSSGFEKFRSNAAEITKKTEYGRKNQRFLEINSFIGFKNFEAVKINKKNGKYNF